MHTRTLGIALIAGCLAGCAAKIPPDATFNPSAWSRVEHLTPGVRIEVRYVTGTPPLRHHFEGTLRRATPDILEIQTEDGMQRLLANQVLRVSTRSKSGSTLAGQGALIGSVLLTLIGAPMLVAIAETDLQPEHVVVPAAVGMAVGALAGSQLRGTRRDVVYVRR